MESTAPPTARAPSHTETIVLSGRDDVVSLLASPRTWLFGTRPIRLGSRFGTRSHRRKTERRLRFWQSMCGCQLAALAFLYVLGAHAWSMWESGNWSLAGLATAFGIAFAAAIVIKLAGMLVARIALAIDLSLLRPNANQPNLPESASL